MQEDEEREPLSKPWEGEFVLDSPEVMDDAAVEILLRNMRAGMRRS